MIAVPDKHTIEALNALRHNRDFERVLDWLKKSRDDSLDYCVSERDEIQLRRQQGATADLTEIIDTASKADQFMRAMR